MVEPRPRRGTACDRRFSSLDLVCEAPGGGGAVLGVPASRSLSVLDGRFEILNLASHVRPLRGCADGPPPTALSTLCPRRPVLSVVESRQTTRPRHPGLHRSPDSGSARPRALPSGRRTAEAPQQAVRWDPWPETTTSAHHRPLVSSQASQPRHCRGSSPAVQRRAGRRGIRPSVGFDRMGPFRRARYVVEDSASQPRAAVAATYATRHLGSTLANVPFQPQRQSARAAVGCKRLLGIVIQS